MLRRPALALVYLCLAGSGADASAQTYEKTSQGTRVLDSPASGLSIKMLVEEANLGGTEVEVGEITFPSSAMPARGHLHGSVEIFYVLTGTLEHVVNGKVHTLTPGMVGIVRPGDDVAHRVPGEEDVKALVIWAPGGESARIAPGFRVRPIGGTPPAP